MPISNKQKRTEYHLITCNHPFMMDAGMSSFTLPELIDWWNFRSNGIYVNRKFFPERDFGLGDLIDPLTYRRTSDAGEAFTRSLHAYSFGAWRFEKYNAGVYKKYSILSQAELLAIEQTTNLENNDDPPLDKDILAVQWEHYNKNPDASIQDSSPYNWENIDFDSYTNKTFDRKSKELVDFPELKRKQNFEDALYPDDYDGAGSSGASVFRGVVPVNLIAMNDYYNLVGFGDSVKDLATQKLLKDIRRSKNAGYISWSGKIPLFINVFENGQKCISEETFNFKLYLFDKKKPLNNSKSQVFPSITLAAHAIGPDGTNQKDKVDGDSSPITDSAPNKKVGGKLKTSYRAYDGTFSAGSEQIYGIVVSDTIPAVEFAEDMVDWAENMDIEQHFKDPINNTHLTPSSGLVIPIDMQNANPFQWSPNYANPKGCRGDNKEKVTVNVFNMSTKEFTKGETVLLTDRYSLWFIDPVAEGAEPALPLEKTVSKWQFTYHMTNQEFFYRFADPTAESEDYDGGQNLNPKVTNCMEAEQALSRKYLAARNKSEYESKYGNGVDADDDADSVLEKDAGKAWPGYAQVTSWDFMGTHLAGLRETKDKQNLGNALVLTQTSKNHKGDPLQEFNNYGIVGGSRFTAPFFGCAFPEGYLGGDETGKYVNLNSAVKEDDNSFTGKGFYVTGQDMSSVSQDQAFFNQDKYGDETALNVFDPTHSDNNISTNISPLYFLVNLYNADELAEEPHCNIFSSKENFYHLPADIGVNGSFNAEYGGPILSLNKVQQYLTNPKSEQWDTPDAVYNNFHDFWQDPGSFQWLYNPVDSETKQITNNPDNSTFDIRPRNPNRVEFRPLKDSVFAQFDPPQVQIDGSPPCESGRATTTIPYPAKRLVEQGFNNYPDVADGSPGIGDVKISKYGGSSPLWGPKTKQRLIAEAGDKDKGELILKQDTKVVPPDDCDSSVPSYPDDVKQAKGAANYSDVGLENKIMPFKYNPYYYTEGGKKGLEWDKLNLGAWYQILDVIYPNYITKNHYEAYENSLSRGAYGVIGAVCTSEMEAGVQVKTNNTLGQPHSFLSNVFYPSWGARQDLTYSDPNTTALFVKIYEAWPRDQTIFDSRFYAVHHFNEGNKLPVFNLDENDKKRPWQSDYRLGPNVDYGEKIDGTLVRPYENPLYEFIYSSGTQQVSELLVQSYYFTGDEFVVNPVSGIPIVHDKIITNVDHKVLSIFDDFTANPFTEEGVVPDRLAVEMLLNSEQIINGYLLKASLVFSEGVVIENKSTNIVVDGDVVKNLDRYLEDKFGEDENVDLISASQRYRKYTPLAPTSLWNVDPNRRARLLPWIYRKHDIGFGFTGEGLIFDPGFIDFENGNVKPEQTLHDIIKEQIGKNIIVADKGAGYKEGNIFTVSGGSGSDVQMRVSKIGEDGEVEALEWIYEEDVIAGNNVTRPLWGYGFLPTDFLPGEATGITSETTSNIRITPVGNVNTSFKAYFVAGYTNYEEFIDRKPQVVTEIKDAYRVSAPNNKDGETGSTIWRDNQDVAIIQLGAQALVLGDGVSFVATPGGLNNTDHVVGENIRSINLDYDREKSNPNVLKGAYSKYDLFFHFHCDLSHQWLESDGLPLTFENLVDMELFPF
jgi:hypothetical protein